MDIQEQILGGKCCLGIELGSTRIKAVLIGVDHAPVASGDYSWENRLEDGYWTYHMEDVWAGLQSAYAGLREQVKASWGVELEDGKSHGLFRYDARLLASE